MPQFLVLIVLLLFTKTVVMGQEVVIEVDKSVFENNQIIDPARYHKLLIIDGGIGSAYSDNRGFNRLLRQWGKTPGTENLISGLLNLKYISAKNVMGINGYLYGQNSTTPTLAHIGSSVYFGRTLIRNKGQILSVHGNLGYYQSHIRFGISPPLPLASISVTHSRSKLFTNQVFIGPSLDFSKVFRNKIKPDRGAILSLSTNINYTPWAGTWRYGYNYSDGETTEFIGEKITDMPKTAQIQYNLSIKLGMWLAR